MSPKPFHAWKFPTINTAQHLCLLRCRGNLSSSIYKPRQINGFFSGTKSRHQHEGGRIELEHTTMVYGVRYQVQEISKGMVYCVRGLSYVT